MVSVVEQWSPVKGYEGVYEVSDHGRIKSLARDRVGKNGSIARLPERILKCNKMKIGYRSVVLAKGDGNDRHEYVHRLVLIAFVGDPPSDLHEGNHKDGVKSNNLLTNLEWTTPSENKFHAYRIGLKKARNGVRHKDAKLNDDIVRIIRESLRNEESLAELGRRYGVAANTIRAIQTGRTWKHITAETPHGTQQR